MWDMNAVPSLLRCVPVLLLAGCGGGSLYLTLGDYEDPPQVELAVSDTLVRPLQTVRLVAAAADDSGYVDRVEFYRYDGERLARLGVDSSPPFEAALVVPDDGRLAVTVFARAIDGEGLQGDSPLISLEIRP